MDPRSAADGSHEARERVGPYLVEHLIASGGMGSVWLGRRDDHAFEKTVAIKFVRPELADARMLARFERERQVLAGLEHAGIARLLDGGTTQDGTPYLVMEYVEGLPIDRFCDERCLDLDARCELFALACEAVEYAHRHHVVHRDLKPNNLLVTAEGVPKLLDFGIAKVLGDEDGLAGSLTMTGDRIFSPRYASPEQCGGGEVTPASDVYALGVMLYELLTGRYPYPKTGASLVDLQRAICEAEPTRASRAVQRSDETTFADRADTTPDEAAASRNTDVLGLSRALRGDLDLILAKALAKDPARRYLSARLLAEDLRSHAAGRKIVARPESLAYRARRFVSRNRLAVGATAAVIGSLGAGLAVSLDQFASAVDARERADRKAAQTREVATGMIFDVHSAIRMLPGSGPAQRVVLTRCLEFLDELVAEAEEDPDLVLEAGIGYLRLADVLGYGNAVNLGLGEETERSAETALELFARVLRARPGDIRAHIGRAEAYEVLASNAGAAGDRPRAFELLDLAADEVDSARAGGAAETVLARLHVSQASVRGHLDFRGGDVERALETLDAAERRYLDAFPEHVSNQTVAILFETRAMALAGSGRYEEAREVLLRALEASQGQLATEPNSERVRHQVHEIRIQLADVLRLLGDYEGALDYLGETLDHRRQRLEIDRTNQSAWVELLQARQEAGQIAEKLGRLDEALEHRSAAIRISDEMMLLWPDNSTFVQAAASSRTMQAQTFTELEEWAASERLCDEALELYDREPLFGEALFNRCATVGIRAKALRELQRTEPAIEATEAFRACSLELIESHPENAWPRVNEMISLDSLGSLYATMGADGDLILQDRIAHYERAIDHYTNSKQRAEALIEEGLLPPQSWENVRAVEASIANYEAHLDGLREAAAEHDGAETGGPGVQR